MTFRELVIIWCSGFGDTWAFHMIACVIIHFNSKGLASGEQNDHYILYPLYRTHIGKEMQRKEEEMRCILMYY